MVVEAEPEAPTARESNRESGDVAPIPQFDPRQGTLLGFELPDDTLASMTEYLGTAQAEPPLQSVSGRVDRGNSRSSEAAADTDALDTAALPIGPGEGAMAEKKVGDEPADDVGETVAAGGSDADAQLAGKPAQGAHEPQALGATEKRTATAKPVGPSAKSAVPKQAVRPAPPRAQREASAAQVGGPPLGSTESKPLSPGAALASLREQAERRPPPAARPSSARPAGQAALSGPASASPAAPFAASTSSGHVDAPRVFETSPSDEFAETVAALQEALLQERQSAQDRWRRGRRWLALTSGGLVVLFAVSVAQTVTFVSFSHRAQAAAQQTQSVLNDQRAALAALASSTSALAARIEPPARPDAASDASSTANTAQRLAKHTHARHAKDKAKPAAH